MSGAFQSNTFQLGAFQRETDITGVLAFQIPGNYTAAISGSVSIGGSFAAQMSGSYVAAFTGGPTVAAALAVQYTGSYGLSASGGVTVGATLAVQYTGIYAFASFGAVSVNGLLSATMTGAYAPVFTGGVEVKATLSTVVDPPYKAIFLGDVDNGYLQVQMVGSYGAVVTGNVTVTASMAAGQVGAYAFAALGGAVVAGTLTVQYSGNYNALFGGTVKVTGALATGQVGDYRFSGEGTSGAFVPRDPALGLIYLVEIDGLKDGETTTFRFGSVDFNTRPVDSVPSTHYAGRVEVPGNFSRSLVADGRTSGIAEVSYGTVSLLNPDGALDEMEDYAFDGQRIRVLSLEQRKPIYNRAIVLFLGTMEQAEFTWKKVSFRVRDRLAELDRPLQSTLYAGTTTSGGLNEAEGRPDDVKAQPKPLAYGTPLNVSAIESNDFEDIFDAGIDGVSSFASVRDKGVALTAMGADYSTVTALRTATITSGRWATQINAGRFALGSPAAGRVTAYPVEGASGAARTAAQVAKRILQRMGMSEGTHFKTEDIAALDAANSAVVGFWSGTEEISALRAASYVLNSIGANISTDRLGVYRMIRFSAPSGDPAITLVEDDIIDGGSGIERVATGDQGKGVPIKRVNLRYARNYSVMSQAELDMVNTTAAYRSFAAQEWRTVTAFSSSVDAAHRLAAEMTVDTALIDEAAAQAECDRLLALYSVARKRFQVPVKSILVERVDLGHVARLEVDRFGLSAGKDFRVIGLDENFQRGVTTLDLWG